MEANYVHKDSTTLVQDKLVKNELNQIELQYNALKQQKFNELLKENQELKQKYLNAVSDYETTMSELQELKKQLEEKENIACNWKDSCLENAGKIEKLENQQKEFIKYLNSYIDLLNDKPDMLEETQKDILEEILQKYKNIIGVLDDNNTTI